MVRLALVLACSFLALETAQAGCELPHAPSKIPDGAQASESEMLAALQTVKRYNLDVNNFLKCLDFEANQNRLPRQEQAVRHNAAIDTLETVATKFNEQMRVYKARNASDTQPPTSVASR